MADIVKLLISGLVLGIVVALARKGEAWFDGFISGFVPESLKGYKITMLLFALILIMFGGKVHKLVPEAGMVLLAVYFADLIEAQIGAIGGDQ